MKKGLLYGLILALLLPVSGQAALSDIQDLDTSLKTPVMTLVAEGAIDGYPDGTFRPQAPISVGEFLKILAIPILQDKIIPHLQSDQEDDLLTIIADGDIEEIAAAAEQYEIIEINGDLNRELRRFEAAEFLASAYKASLIGVDTDDLPFVDVFDSDIQKSVLFLYINDIIQGRDDTHFAPEANITRAEAAKVLYLAKNKLMADLYYDQYGWEVGGIRVEITDVSPTSLLPGERATVIFTIKDTDTGKIVPGIDTDDVHVQVIQGSAEVKSVDKIGEGVFLATIQADEAAAPGHLNIQISLVYGRLYVTTTDDYFADETTRAQSDIRVFPEVVSRNNSATIIAIPRDHHGDPVSGLDLTAFVNSGGGRITDDLTEEPAGSGMYVGTYTAGNIADTVEIGVRILDYGGNNTSYVTFEVK